jgi:two-component system, sensor histidine kinase LadS
MLFHRLSFLILFVSYFGYGQIESVITPLSLDVETPVKGTSMFVYHDLDSSFSVSNITSLASIFELFQPYTNQTPNFGFATHDIWIAFALENTIDDSLSGYLQFDNPILDYIDVYRWNDNSFLLVGQAGDQQNGSSNVTLSRNLTVPIHITENNIDYFLVRLNNGGEQFHFSLSFLTESAIRKQDHFHQFFFGIYFGILVFVILFNTFLFFSLREKLSLYYIFYILSLGLLQLSLNGFFNEITPLLPGHWLNRLNPFFASTGVYFLLQFSREFLQLEQFARRTNRVLHIFSLLVLVNVILSIIPHVISYRISVVLINILTLLLTITIIPIAAYTLKQKFKPARYFILAFLFLVVAVGAFVAKKLWLG